VPDTPDLERTLREHFGHAAFRGPQRAIIEHVRTGGDALVIMATGEGKSLCYQLPALLADGLTLVVSPLIALMEDQVAALRARGIAAACIHSMLESGQRQSRLRAALDGRIRLLYVTPERFRVGTFLDDIRAARVPLLAIDEAHCVSHWGHDFRPDYSRLGEVRQALGAPPTLALTATATPDVQRDIVAVLRMPHARLFHTGIERPNLHLAVHEVQEEEDKLARLHELFAEIGGPAIVYFALIRDLERVESELRRAGYDPLVYHGKLSPSERAEQQARFQASADGVILATNAFGMGVDKADIRCIVHHQVPRTLEAYYQEIGRAGRDGAPSVCELLYCEPDVSIQREFTEWANPDRAFLTQVVAHLEGLGERVQGVDVQTLRETFLVKNRRDGRIETCLRLLRTAGCTEGDLGKDFVWVRTPDAAEIAQWLPDDKRQRDLRGLLEMVRYARETGCRKRFVHRYFGFDEFEHAACGACDGEIARGAWLAAQPAATRRPIPRGETRARQGDGLQRGDWISVADLGLCAVTLVHETPRGTRIEVEVAKDLSRRRLDLRRVRWRRVRE
jgi:ATP-dependent DNA helicase RecQ